MKVAKIKRFVIHVIPAFIVIIFIGMISCSENMNLNISRSEYSPAESGNGNINAVHYKIIPAQYGYTYGSNIGQDRLKWYRVSISSGAQLRLFLTPPSGCDYDLYLTQSIFTTENMAHRRVPQIGSQIASSIGTGDMAESINHTSSGGGTYFVVVHSHSGSGTFTLLSNYRLDSYNPFNDVVLYTMLIAVALTLILCISHAVGENNVQKRKAAQAAAKPSIQSSTTVARSGYSPSSSSGSQTCPNCGAQNSMDLVRCYNCRGPLRSGTAAPTAATRPSFSIQPPASTTATTASASEFSDMHSWDLGQKPAPVESGGMITCPNCGAKNPAFMYRCGECNASLR